MDETVYYQAREETAGRLYWLDQSGSVQGTVLRGRMTVGRRREQGQADIALRSRYVSGRHGEILRLEGRCYYRDVGSGNGTWFRDRLLTPNEPVCLEDGDILRVGNMEQPDDPDNVVLLFTTRGQDGEVWEIFTPPADAESFQIGRAAGPGTGPRLTGQDISRQQCVFSRTVTGWAVENVSRTNPTQLNAGAVEVRTGLYSQDVVRMANSYAIFDGTRFHVLTAPRPEAASAPPVREAVRTDRPGPGESPRPAPARPVPAPAPVRFGSGEDRLEICIVKRSVKRRQASVDILRDIRLSVACGELVLILGGSGAGKTTFLNAVMGYEPANGRIRFGGRDVYRDYEKMKYEIGYVPQEDLLRKGDLVIETLNNAARMRLPRSMTPEERMRRVRETLVTFGLERERDQMVSKLSGGQRKRLSIAVEYIGQPTLFFLDEPDSGLDGIMARSLMEHLRFIADTGKVVMVITHAPDRAADLFDKVVVLARSTEDNCGHLAFYGSLEEAKRFFRASSMEEVVRRINRPDEGGDGLAEHYIRKYRKESERGR